MPSARDLDTILDDTEQTSLAIAPNMDVQKGPPAVIYYTMSQQLAQAEQFAAYLKSLYQTDDAELIDDEDIFQLGLNFGKDPNLARASEVKLYFYRYSRPPVGEIPTVPIGAIASSDDGRYNFITTTEGPMNGDVADVYFNADKKWYEIPVSAEAVEVGTDYDLPPETINTLSDALSDFDGVINYDYAKRGTDPLDKNQFLGVIQSAQQGLDRDLAGNIVANLNDINAQGYDDISIVSSTDYDLFVRNGHLSKKIGYDVYLITDSVADDILTGTAAGGEMYLDLPKRPVLSVRYVVVDGTEVAFSLDLDLDPVYADSPLSGDRVTLATPLQPAQTYQVAYQYYDMVYDGYQSMQGRFRPFESDVLVRRASDVQMYVAASLQEITTADRDDVVNDIRAFTEGYFRSPDNPATSQRTFVTSLNPLDYQRAVEQTVDGVQQFKLSRFARMDRAYLDIEVAVFDGATEYPVLAAQFDIS